MHYQGQRAQLATLEGLQIPHLGQWAVVQHSPTNANAALWRSSHEQKSGEDFNRQMHANRQIQSRTHTTTYMYIHFTKTPKIIAQILLHFQPTV